MLTILFLGGLGALVGGVWLLMAGSMSDAPAAGEDAGKTGLRLAQGGFLALVVVAAIQLWRWM